MSQERKDLIRSLGAEIRLVSREQGGFQGAIRMSEDFARQTAGAFLPRQFENPDNVTAHFETTGPESGGEATRSDGFIACSEGPRGSPPDSPRNVVG